MVVAVAVFLGGGYYFGYQSGAANPRIIRVQNVENADDIKDEKINFAVFWDAWSKLKDYHFKGNEVSGKDLVYSAITGLAAVFKDPNTIFLRNDTGEVQKFREDVKGNFGGIGAEIGLDKVSQLIVVAPLKKSPAEKAGLKSGDKIVKIDGLATLGITVDEAVKKIRGPINSKVVLNIEREDWQSSRDIEIMRQEIVVPTVDLEILKGGIAHIKLYSFNENAPTAFYAAAVNTLLNRSKGIVLDLRNNPGGFLDVAINIAGWFLDKGQTVTVEHFRDSSRDRTFRSSGNGAFKNTPVVIILNEGSASASEILAGALKDQRNSKIVGKKSFGKGTVQELIPLIDNSELKITVANWLRPSGETIEKTGITPDFEVDITEKDLEDKKDPQLEKAIEVLSGEIANN